MSKETNTLPGSAEKVIAKDKNGKNVPKLEIVNVILMHRNVVNNNYQEASKTLFTFVLGKQFGQLTIIALQLLTMLKTTNVELLNCDLQIKLTDHLK